MGCMESMDLIFLTAQVTECFSLSAEKSMAQQQPHESDDTNVTRNSDNDHQQHRHHQKKNPRVVFVGDSMVRQLMLRMLALAMGRSESVDIL